MTNEVTHYLSKIKKRYKTGISREHSYRGDLQNLLESLLPDILVTNEPARIACGAPDYILTKDDIPIGFIEAKDIGKSLDNKEYKEQFDRYRTSLSNLIITDYLTFRFYLNGECITEIALANLKDTVIIPLPENVNKFYDLMRNFALYQGQTIQSPTELSKMMAAKARLLANIIENALVSDEGNEEDSTLQDQMEAFKKVLLHTITAKEFADVYAQTIAYGMFAARLHDDTLNTFSRQEAATLIPHSNPFLRKLFQYIAGYDLDSRIVWIVDALVDIFRATDVRSILKDFGRATRQSDPIIHFYEDFLAEYDPRLRKSRGVWYTPEPVVHFIVRAVDDLLKTEFKLAQGLADTTKTKIKVTTSVRDGRTASGYKEVKEDIHQVQILDPATGTGTFLAEVVKYIYEQHFQAMKGMWHSYVEQDLIPRLHGFELLMASYAMAHLKLDLLLQEKGYSAKKNQRLNIFLTNSLEEHHPDTGTLFASWLSKEASEANYLKRDMPVMVVMGNPPYSGHSANKGEWIEELLKDYKQEPSGGALQERNSKWLNDDYVKFIRYGQHYIEKNGEGILAYISNNGFLDNPTFRGMRWHLLNTFDKIYIIDLHGNAKKKEVAPDGSVDQNVFDIQQGVAISLFVKTGKKSKKQLAQVYHYDLYGHRQYKYDYLWNHSLAEIPFVELPNTAPQYFMVQKDFAAEKSYMKGFSVTDLFPVNSVGIVTARDKLTIHHTAEQVKKVIQDFASLDTEAARSKYNLGKDVRDWKVHLAQQDIINTELDESHITKIAYRPFDIRYTYYTGKTKGFHCMPRHKVMYHLYNHNNLGIGFSRSVVGGYKWNDIFIINSIVEFGYMASRVSNSAPIAPLYLYPDTTQQSIDQQTQREPNLDKVLVKKIAKKLKLRFTAEKEATSNCFAPIDLLDYIYAVLHAPKYRDTYKEFLKIDFPRVPFPDPKNFWQLVELGGQLRALHLLDNITMKDFITDYPKEGDNIVTRKMSKASIGWEADKQDRTQGKVWINDQQYFNHVPLVAWEFYIGGYQPAQKWLKDRLDKQLYFDDIIHYQKMIVALTQTSEIMCKIDTHL